MTSQGSPRPGSDGRVGFIEGEMEGTWRKRDKFEFKAYMGQEKIWNTEQIILAESGFM